MNKSLLIKHFIPSMRELLARVQPITLKFKLISEFYINCQRCETKWSWYNFGHNPCIHLESLKKIVKWVKTFNIRAETSTWELPCMEKITELSLAILVGQKILK